jgi:hypothetical protein
LLSFFQAIFRIGWNTHSSKGSSLDRLLLEFPLLSQICITSLPPSFSNRNCHPYNDSQIWFSLALLFKLAPSENSPSTWGNALNFFSVLATSRFSAREPFPTECRYPTISRHAHNQEAIETWDSNAQLIDELVVYVYIQFPCGVPRSRWSAFPFCFCHCRCGPFSTSLPLAYPDTTPSN